MILKSLGFREILFAMVFGWRKMVLDKKSRLNVKYLKKLNNQLDDDG